MALPSAARIGKVRPLPRLLLGLVVALAQSASAATFVVTKTADTVDGICDADCSLRDALIAANAAPGVDAVVVPAGVYVLTRPDTGEDGSLDGDLDVADDTLLIGAGADRTIIDGNAATRVLHILPGARSVELTGLTLRNGRVVGAGGGVRWEDRITPGPITPLSPTLLLQDVTMTGHRATAGGGGISIGSGNVTLTVVDCTVTDNSADGPGGGLDLGPFVRATVTRGVIARNSATSGGGLRYNGFNVVDLLQSTVAGNVATAGDGGGILNAHMGLVNVNASTISGNRAALNGGGLANTGFGILHVDNSTVSGNAASGGAGGGVYNASSRQASGGLIYVTVTGNASARGGRSLHEDGRYFTYRGTILAGPVGGPNCAGQLYSSGWSLASDASCGPAGQGDMQGIDPRLAPLADNGGPTLTHALCAGSPAVDAAGPPASATDQRGVPRPVSAAADIGAFEGSIPCAAEVPPVVEVPSLSPGALLLLGLLLAGLAWQAPVRRNNR